MIRRKRRNTKKTNINLSLDFDKSQFVESELQDKISLWILRIIINLGGHREFIDKENYIRRDEVADYLGIQSNPDETRSYVLDRLKNDLTLLENKKTFTTSSILEKNIKNLSKLMSLNSVEQQILEFVVLLNQYEVLSDAALFLGNEMNSSQVFRALITILDIPKDDIKKAFHSSSKLSKSSLISIYRNTNDLKNKIDTLSDEFIDNMLNLDEDVEVMIRDSVRKSSKSELCLKDYTHIQKDINILVPYLKNAVKSKQTGVNILLYGVPGTGKTELSKVLSKILKTNLYEISYSDNSDEPIDGPKRLKAYKTAQSLLSNKKTLLMYDEAEDIFDSSESFFAPKRQKDKAWLNKILETNTIPTIWITNNIYSIDNALVRRFDMSIEVPIPKKSQREKIITTYANKQIEKETISKLALHEDIAPAFVSRAEKVVSGLDSSVKDKAFTQIINNTLKAQGFNEIKENNTLSLPNNYNPNFINTTTNLEELTMGIKETSNARLCLYGAAGTGKSAFGKYIADSLDKKVILKKASDLQSKWIGECEKNIANAFTEAKEENAVLIFDEVDSFLQDRENAKASWEISQVNEMLVQMENFDGIFVATTNLMDNLDRASLRRFDLKLKFDYLNPTQSWEIFKSYAKQFNLKPTNSFKSAVHNLRYLAPGDFAAVLRQSRFRPIKDIKDLISRLKDEISVKRVDNSRKMGFL